MPRGAQPVASQEAPASIIVQSKATLAYFDGHDQAFDTVKTERSVAVGNSAGMVSGIAAESFMMPYRDCMLRFAEGEAVIADPMLHEFMTRNGCPVEWLAP
jgi:hypothetical protein